jgi:hypothetical protein
VGTQGRTINVNFIENLDSKSDWRYRKGKQATDQPVAGISDQVVFNCELSVSVRRAVFDGTERLISGLHPAV